MENLETGSVAEPEAGEGIGVGKGEKRRLYKQN